MVTRGVQEDDVRRVVGYYATTLISLERPSSMARGLRSVAYHAGARKTPLKHVSDAAPVLSVLTCLRRDLGMGRQER